MKVQAYVTKNTKEDSHVKAYATIVVEDCGRLNGIKLREDKNGKLTMNMPSVPMFKDGQPFLDENGKQKFKNAFNITNDEVKKEIKALILEAYNGDGYAYRNQQKGEFVNSHVDVTDIRKCNGEKLKAAATLNIGGYIEVPDVLVKLGTTKDTNENFLYVNYAGYKSEKDGKTYFNNYIELLEDGKMWNSKDKVEEAYNFKYAVEGKLIKETKALHPDLVLAENKKSVEDKIQDATAEANKQKAYKEAEAEKDELTM